MQCDHPSARHDRIAGVKILIAGATGAIGNPLLRYLDGCRLLRHQAPWSFEPTRKSTSGIPSASARMARPASTLSGLKRKSTVF
jgi:hypothetical protein